MVFYDIGWCLSTLLGPFMGGLLADPVNAYPEIVKHLPEWLVNFLHSYPFLLPNLVAAVFNVVAIFVFVFKLKETRVKSGHNNETSSFDTSGYRGIKAHDRSNEITLHNRET